MTCLADPSLPASPTPRPAPCTDLQIQLLCAGLELRERVAKGRLILALVVDLQELEGAELLFLMCCSERAGLWTVALLS